jgi:hypothetical protein
MVDPPGYSIVEERTLDFLPIALLRERVKPPLMAASHTLHPLVLLNVSDHHTRYKAQQQAGQPVRVLGCVLGTHNGRTIELCNSFEIKFDGLKDGVPQVDSGFLVKKQEQCAPPLAATHGRAQGAVQSEGLPRPLCVVALCCFG